MYGYFQDPSINYPESHNDAQNDQIAHLESIKRESLMQRIKETYQQLEYLKCKLALEKEQLQLELMASQSFIDNCNKDESQYHRENGLPITSELNLDKSYQQCKPIWNQQCQQTFIDIPYQNISSPQINQAQVPYYVLPQVPIYDSIHAIKAELVRDQLENVEKLCDEEMDRMRSSISSLRSVRKYWECYNNLTGNLDFNQIGDYDQSKSAVRNGFVSHKHRHRHRSKSSRDKSKSHGRHSKKK